MECDVDGEDDVEDGVEGRRRWSLEGEVIIIIEVHEGER